MRHFVTCETFYNLRYSGMMAGRIVPYRNATSMNRFHPYSRSQTMTQRGQAIRNFLSRAMATSLSRSHTRSMTRRRQTSSGTGVTNHYDRRLIYRKRRMPRFRRRRWRRFSRRIHAVVDKDLGSRTVVRNTLTTSSVVMNVAAATQHTVFYLGLYSLNSPVNDAMRDINEISQDTDLGTTGKAIFQSGILDITVRNVSARVGTSTNPQIRLEIDVYEISVGVLLGPTPRATNLTDCFDQGAADTAIIPGQASALLPVVRGWTPWDFPSALSEFKIRIWKKTKFFLNENETFTYQVRDPKRHVIDQQSMTQYGENLPGVTRYIYFIYKPAPGYFYQDTTPDAYGISVGYTRKYLYKILDKTQDYDMYNT